MHYFTQVHIVYQIFKKAEKPESRIKCTTAVVWIENDAAGERRTKAAENKNDQSSFLKRFSKIDDVT